MDRDPRAQATQVLTDIRAGKREAADRLMGLVYDELHAQAHRRLLGESGPTLQTTVLVHEAYLRMLDQTRVDWQGRTHFLAIAVRSLRRALVDHARARRRDKRGGDRVRVELPDELALPAGAQADVIAVDEALDALAELDARQARVVELRFFAQMTMEEIAEALGVSKRTAEADWTAAKAWLRRELAGGAPSTE